LVAIGVPVAVWALTHFSPRFKTARARSGEHRREQVLRLAQTVLLVGAGVAMLAAGLVIPAERRLLTSSDLGLTPDPNLSRPMSEAKAMKAYSPVLRLDPKELWPEESVDTFLRHTVTRPTRCRRAAAASPPRCELRTIRPGERWKVLERTPVPHGVIPGA